LSQIGVLEFYDVDLEKFPLVNLARQALMENNSFSIALNAAKEVVVEAFLREEIKFFEIPAVVAEVVEDHHAKEVDTVNDIFEIDRDSRLRTRNLLKQR
jgi:1-deoxy-D-xylulose-5-phosphate reductoisomerase